MSWGVRLGIGLCVWISVERDSFLVLFGVFTIFYDLN